MYRILLVDDEILVRDAIKENIDWKGMDCELVGDCENGKEAAEFVKEHPVDIVLTDILMPYMDGMELSNFLHDNYPEIVIVIFSGFGEFEYAKKAIQYGVSEYLLKPVTATELTEVIEKMKEKVEQQRLEKTKMDVLAQNSEKYRKNKQMIRSKNIEALVNCTTDVNASIERLEDMGIDVRSSYHEHSPYQHEIDLQPVNALAAADNIVTFRMTCKTIASRHGLHATFMPKPMNDSDGCGMHLKMTLMDLEGNNILSDPADSYGLSELGYHFMAGIMAHVRGLTAVTNPLVNSYKRIVPGNEAPSYIVWSSGNRSPLISVPRTSAKDMHIELRNPDPCVNSYLAFAGIIAAGLEGIKKGLMPQAATELNIYRLSEEECEKLNLKRLPKSLSEAVEEMENDPLVMKTLGEYISGKYVRAKRREVSQYQAYVTDWETRQYLNKY